MSDSDGKSVKKEPSIPLELRDGEVIKKEIRPNMSKYLYRQAVKGVVLFLIIYVLLTVIFSLMYKVNKGGAAALYISSIILLAYMAISMISYPRKLYWITTQRHHPRVVQKFRYLPKLALCHALEPSRQDWQGCNTVRGIFRIEQHGVAPAGARGA